MSLTLRFRAIAVVGTLLLGLAPAARADEAGQPSSFTVAGQIGVLVRPERGGPDSVLTPLAGVRGGYRTSAFGIDGLRLGVDGELLFGHRGAGNDTVEVSRTSTFALGRASAGYRVGGRIFAFTPELYGTLGLSPALSATSFGGGLHLTPSLTLVGELGTAVGFQLWGAELLVSLGLGFHGLEPMLVHRVSLGWTF